MFTASHIVTLARSGKTPRRKVTRVLCDDDWDAVLCACQWVVWSQKRAKNAPLPRWDRWKVERLDGESRTLVREGDLEDAKAEYREEDLAETTFRTVAEKDILGSQGRKRLRARQNARGNRGASRLAQFATRVLKDL